MTKPIRLDSEAEEEIDAAVAWYEAQRPGLGLELLEALDEAKARLVDDSGLLAIRYRAQPGGLDRKSADMKAAS
jgi:hypothetical protein